MLIKSRLNNIPGDSGKKLCLDKAENLKFFSMIIKIGQ